MKKSLRLFAAASLVFLGAQSIAREPDQVVLTPAHAFSGSSEGNGWLRIFPGRRKSFHVESHGVEREDGRFRLDQTVVFQGERPRYRTWTIEPSSSLHYSGALSDAAGPVTGEAQGKRLMLRYRLKGPLVMHQVLQLSADGRTIDNTGRITLLGIAIGHLHETIKRENRSPRR